ncbi:MAG: hypothetical protein FVQ83_10690 [Chloroflexi bacterium]|nr:hypothetical protein [Chloroflexota bacterium]
MDVNKRISLRLRGLEKDAGDVRFNDFIQQLALLNKALSETQKLYSDKSIAYFKIVDLQHTSPAFVELEAVPQRVENEPQTQSVVDKFFKSINEIDRGELPEGFSYDTFQAYKGITSLRDKKRITEVTISRNGENPNKLETLSLNIEKIMGSDEYEIGSYTGKLEYLNVHSNQNVFYIYPTSHLPKLKCTFPQSLKQEVIAAIDQYVRVYGEKKFKPNLKKAIPFHMRVSRIEIFPPQEDLPTLEDLRGIASQTTGEENSEDFVKGIRDGW